MRAFQFIPTLLLAAAVTTGAAHATDIVRVELNDASNDPALSGMQMKLDRSAAKAGQVTIEAVNRSTALVHELLVLQTGLSGAALPYDAKNNVFVEGKVKSLGEIQDLAPGTTGKLTLALRPGSYLLACNQPGHVHAGMWARLQVAPR